MELSPELVADLRALEQARDRYEVEKTDRNAQRLALAAGCLTKTYLPAHTLASPETPRG